MLDSTDPPTVTVSVGDPHRTKGASIDADTEIMQATWSRCRQRPNGAESPPTPS